MQIERQDITELFGNPDKPVLMITYENEFKSGMFFLIGNPTFYRDLMDLLHSDPTPPEIQEFLEINNGNSFSTSNLL